MPPPATHTVRLTCPNCETTYTGDRCGLPTLRDGQRAEVTVKCVVCAHVFDTILQPNIVVVLPTWVRRVILRETPTSRQEGVQVEVRERPE